MPSLLDLLGKTSDAVLGTVPNVYSGLLSEDELRAAKSRAQSDALANMANAFYAAGEKGTGTGRALLQGLSAGRGGFDEALKGQVQEKINQQKIQQALQGQKRAAEAQKLATQLYSQPTPAKPASYVGGAPYGADTPAQPGGFNQDVFQQLFATPEGREIAKQYTDLIPAARKAGMIGQIQPSDNPFRIFASDPLLSAPIKNLANQLSSSFEKGMIDPDKVDERVRQLATMQQQAMDREAGREQQKSMANLTASLRPEKMVTVMDDSGSPITVPESQAAGQPIYSPSAAKARKEETTKKEAKQQLSEAVSDFGQKYKSLKKSGGIVSSENDSIDNIFARLSSSDIGQFVGGAVGTDAQTLRQEIAQKRPLLLNLIKNATGMSAQQMNSNNEMQMYLSAATDPKLSFEANMAALEGLDKMFGLGLFKAKEEENPFGKKL
jgi:hypothetical protein